MAADHRPHPEPVERRDFLRKAALAGAGVMGACADSGAPAAPDGEATVWGPEVNWRLASSFPPSLDILHGGAVRFAERVGALTGGRFSVRVYAAGEIVPALQVMDAVMQGTVHAGYSAGYYYIGKSPALAFDAAVPFGLNARQQIAWMYHGGGIELLREVYGEFGVIQFPCGNTGVQMGGWFREPVESLADLSGLIMRIPGMGGEIMQRLGASVQVLGAPDIYPALERGAIDATEWVGPYDDEKLGFYQVAPYYYMPGWWEPGPSLSLQVNQEAFDELPAAYQEMVASVCKEVLLDQVARYDAANPAALRRLVDEHGAELRVFPEEMLEAAWRESQDYLEEQAASNAAFRRVYDNWRDFRDIAFPYFAGNEMHYAEFAFRKIQNALQVAG